MVSSIDQRYTNIRPGQCLRRGKPRKSSSDDDYSGRSG
jgi:hypothetical protein